VVQFTKLRLTGFKSFVDPTELVVEPGMTGVVGPNGCGKSNLVEALRWVMGETSAKQMRGGEMDDVIFGGTSHRPPRNVAEVTVGLDNSRRTAPGLFNEHETLEITRRITRGAGSTYKLNGKDVRAKDVQLLFADLATGARSTAMVSQGKVGQLINAKPAQRRSFLEEAAGISGLHSRRHEAELRLRAAETNLQRVEDVLSALETQLRSLRRQVGQAQKYRRLSEQIRTTEAMLLYLRWAQAASELDQARSALKAAETKVAELTGKAASASREQAIAAHALPPLREAETEASARLQRLLVAREQLDAEEKRLAEARRQAETRLRQIADDVERERARSADAETAVARLDDERRELMAAAEGEDDVHAAAAERVETLALQVEDLEARVTTLTERLAAEEAARNAAARRVEESRLRAERAERRLREAEDALAAARRDAEQADDLMLAEEGVQAAELAVDDARAAAEEAEDQARRLAAERDAARERLQAAAADRARLRAEVDALDAVLTETVVDGGHPPILDQVTVAPGYEQALGAALGDDLSAPATDDAAIGWTTLPPLDSPPPLPAGVEPLADKVTGAPALARRLSQVGVVSDAAFGSDLRHDLRPGQRLVSPDGALWRWDGYTVAAGAPSAAAQRLRQKNRLATLREELAVAEARVAEAEDLAAAAKERADSAQAAGQTARDRVRAAESALTAARDAHATAARRAAALQSRLDTLTDQAEQLAADLAEARAEAEEARLHQEETATGTVSRAEADRLRAELAERRSWLTEARSTLDRVQRDAADRRRRLQAIDSELEGWQRRKDGAAEQRAELDERHRAVLAEIEDLAARPLEITEQRDALLGQIDEAEAARRHAADRLAEADSRLKEADGVLRDAEHALASAREDKVRAEGAVDQADHALRQSAATIAERLDCTPDQARAAAGVEDDAPTPPIRDLEDRLARLNRERDAMGPVNLRAEQEVADLEKQTETLIAERDDLLGAIDRLRKAIAELNREGRHRLLNAFEKVDGHFRRLFVRLFGGGRAHLALTESDDPLDAGLEIFASPPGKRLQILSLLSGGEQAMTALALLFAVFLVNPAPICVLDEVDAPLDDANVDRFCTMLDELTRMAQTDEGPLAGRGTRFLVVTHHRMTMARMDRLYGVTMAERGVSKLVSVDLREAERLRETA